jgi:hypothetical protein
MDQRPDDLNVRTAASGRMTAPTRRQDIGSRPRREGNRSRELSLLASLTGESGPVAKFKVKTLVDQSR